MATMIRERAPQASGFVDRAHESGRRWDVTVANLIDELVIAFFVAMAVVWVVTTVAGFFG